MAASASMPSLLQLDERLRSVPEEPSTSYGHVPAGRAAALPAPAAPRAPHRWVDALEMMEAQARGEQLGAQLELAGPLGSGASGGARPMRKCASVPVGLHSMAQASSSGGGLSGDSGMEVYVVLRSFQEFGGGLFKRLPRGVRRGVRDAGVCHYLAVFKQRDGSLVQFDFGPRGGDIHVAQGPFAFLSKSADGKMQRYVPGEVRERRLSRLPEAHMYVGRTPLTMADIRAWNTLQEQGCMDYELHTNDCRHYINCLVKYTTGKDGAASSTLQHRWRQGRAAGAYGLASGVVRLGQMVTDLANWGKVQLATSVGMYGALALSGHRALAALRPLAALPAGAKARLAKPVGRALAGPVRQALTRKPVVVGTTAAVATLAASTTTQAPALRETVTVGARVASGLRTAAQAALAATSTAVSRASLATRRTTNQAAVLAGSLAGAATRGAAGLMAGRPVLEARLGAPASPQRASLPSFRAVDRSQRLALAVTSAARR